MKRLLWILATAITVFTLAILTPVFAQEHTRGSGDSGDSSGVLDLRIFDQSRKPIAGAVVKFIDWRGQLVLTSTTSPNGRVRSTLEKGRYTLVVEHPSYQPQKMHIEVTGRPSVVHRANMQLTSVPAATRAEPARTPAQVSPPATPTTTPPPPPSKGGNVPSPAPASGSTSDLPTATSFPQDEKCHCKELDVRLDPDRQNSAKETVMRATRAARNGTNTIDVTLTVPYTSIITCTKDVGKRCEGDLKLAVKSEWQYLGANKAWHKVESPNAQSLNGAKAPHTQHCVGMCTYTKKHEQPQEVVYTANLTAGTTLQGKVTLEFSAYKCDKGPTTKKMVFFIDSASPTGIVDGLSDYDGDGHLNEQEYIDLDPTWP